MPDAIVEQVRRFNRVVTERVGALDDRFLGRDMPLGEARLLWEIGPEGCEVRLLPLSPQPRLGLREPASALARGRGTRRDVGRVRATRVCGSRA